MPKYRENHDEIQLIHREISQVKVKIYRLNKLEKKQDVPCIIYFHGGGFVFGEMGIFI
jgi:acetyl esterase/lipase